MTPNPKERVGGERAAMKHLVFYSGGIASFFTAKRVIDEHGPDAVTLLFTDTLIEDEDLYRFLRESAKHLGSQLVEIADGRKPWEVFRDVRLMGNTRMDPCSRILKRELSRAWVEEHYPVPDTVTLYIGLDWSEGHRIERPKAAWQPYVIEAPLLGPPYLTRAQMLTDCRDLGIEPPRLYAMGASHNNCGGFCVKAGQKQFEWLLRVMPERYAHHEQQEQDFRDWIGKDVTILRDRTGGTNKRLTLAALRKRIEAGGSVPEFDWGGCGCFSE